MKIHLIMPMAGEGTRFLEEGFIGPKPMMQIQNRPFFFWAIQSIAKFVELDDITCIVLEKHMQENKIDQEIKKYFPDARIIGIPNVLKGPTLTCLEGISQILDENPILFNDCDHMFQSSELYSELFKKELSCDAGLVTFNATTPQYGYVKYDNNQQIIGTVEKKVVSNRAICGAYLFKNVNVFRNASKKYLKECEYQEFYLSGVYNSLEETATIKAFNADFHINFGTPEEYKEAISAPEFTVLK